MPRVVDQDVHTSFIEFKNSDEQRCLSVQCMYCQSVRAKNTTRQKLHLINCESFNQAHPDARERLLASLPKAAAAAELSFADTSYSAAQIADINAIGGPSGDQTIEGTSAVNNPDASSSGSPGNPALGGDDGSGQEANGDANRIGTMLAAAAAAVVADSQAGAQSSPGPGAMAPPANMGLGGGGVAAGPHTHAMLALGTPPAKKQKTKHVGSGAGGGEDGTPGGGNEIPFTEVHQQFAEFRAKDGDKCVSVRCLHCHQVRAKNTSRQRQHLLECKHYLSATRDRVPANHLRAQFTDDDVARNLILPIPSLEIDFRMSIKLRPKLSLGAAAGGGQRGWIYFIGGTWAGTWGKGSIIPGGQDSETTHVTGNELCTKISVNLLLQTNDELPAIIRCKTKGWLIGDKELMERMEDPMVADSTVADRYRFRANITLESEDPRYTFVNTSMWLGSGCKMGSEIIYDAFRVS